MRTLPCSRRWTATADLSLPDWWSRTDYRQREQEISVWCRSGAVSTSWSPPRVAPLPAARRNADSADGWRWKRKREQVGPGFLLHSAAEIRLIRVHSPRFRLVGA